MRLGLVPAGMLAVLLAALQAFCGGARAETFRFAALGDMPYGDPKVAVPRYEALIAEINRRAPRFTVHVGDVLGGGNSICSDANLLRQLELLNTFAGALVYTPGDNEWTDCHRRTSGGFDVIERLAFLRTNFFKSPQSLGKAPLALERQGDVDAQHKAFVENARFVIAGVQFATLHVVGSNNGFEVRDRKAVLEFFDRDAANIAWLRSTFFRAAADKAVAVVIALQADMFEFDFDNFRDEGFLRHSGFANVAPELSRLAKAFARPVLLIYGDSHHFRVHRPLRRRAPNILALEVFGAEDMHAVEVTVDTADPAVFSFRPIWNPGG